MKVRWVLLAMCLLPLPVMAQSTEHLDACLGV